MYTSQPQNAVSVDWGNPLSRGLQALHNCANRVDAVSGRGLITYGNIIKDIRGSVGSKGSALSSVDALTNPVITDNLLEQTIFAYFYQPPSTQYFSYVCGAAKAGNYFGLSCYHNGIAGRSGLFYGSSAIISGDVLSSGLHTMAGTQSADGLITLYIDGNTANSISVPPYIIAGGLFSSCAVASGVGSSISTVFLAAKYDRCLSSAEVKRLGINPWQLFKQPARRLFIPASLPWFLISQPYTKQLDSLPHGVLLYNSLFIPTHERIVTSLPKYILPYHDLLVPTHDSVAVSLPKHIESVIELVGGTFTALHDYLVQYIYQETFYHPSVERTFYVKPEQRVYNVSAENRVFTLQPESRVYNVPVK
jgi:hypothetical protein